MTDQPATESELFVVGVGASAGGLEALERMFDHVPDDLPEVAFVVVQHLSPDFKSLMDELLARHTKLKIHRVEDGMTVEAGAIYLIPPKKDMIISNGKLLLTERDSTQQLSLPIDHFFRSLAQDCGPRSIGVILSGTGSDGSRGIRHIHDAGGLVMVQSEDTARFDGMPRAAIDSGAADVVVAPKEIGGILKQYLQEPIREQLRRALEDAESDESATSSLFRALQKEYGLDFRYYKPTTITRRIQRRISMTHTANIGDYAELVTSDREERRALYHDLLIGVTRFFRDSNAFHALDEELTNRLATTWRKEQIRVWVCACATGEEAYSIAILLHERLTGMDREPNVKIFATDIDRESLEFASQGIYPETCLGEMSRQRLERYFRRTERGYQVSQEIRQMIVFAPHNILRDAPFTNLHLVTCRNLLIYFNAEAQKKALSLFHFGLKAGGVLFLGSSESPGSLSDELGVLHKDARLYSKLHDVRLPVDLRSPLQIAGPAGRSGSGFPYSRGMPGQSSELLGAYDVLLSEFMPPAVLVDDVGSVVQTFGEGAKFLHLPVGRISTSLLDMVDGELRLALSGVIPRVRTQGEPVVYSSVAVHVDGGKLSVRVTVSPVVQKTGRMFLLIRFEHTHPAPRIEIDETQEPLHESAAVRIRQLETELQYARENLQATIEELETANEELQATNEELIASNEELQSTNEELHSVNEELYTVNAEHQRKIGELTEVNADMDNLLASTEVHTVFLDEDLRIRRFTPKSVEVFNFVGADIGRRFDAFTNHLGLDTLNSELNAVLESGKPREREVSSPSGVDMLLRILPYFSEKRIRGVVLTLIDISRIKVHQARLEAVFNASPTCILLVAEDGTIRLANKRTEEVTGYAPDELIGQKIECLLPTTVRTMHVGLRDGFMAAPIAREMGRGRDLLGQRKDGMLFPVEVGLTPFEAETESLILVNLLDVTERRRGEESRQRLAAIVESSDDAIVSEQLDGRIQTWNPGAERLYGFTEEEAVGRRFRDLVAIAGADDSLGNSTDEGRIHFGLNGAITTEDVRVRKDGSLVPVSVTLSPIRDEKGSTVGTASIARNISARVEVQKRLAHRERELRLITDNVPELICYVDCDLKFQFVNRSCEELWQRSRQDIVGRPVVELIGATAFADAEPMMRDAFSGSQVSSELLIPEGTGRRFWATVTYTPDVVDGEVRGLFATIVDVTALKQAENRYERALAGAGDGLYDWPVDSDEFFGGPRFWQLIGQPGHAASCKLQEFFTLIHPDDVEGLKTAINDHVDGRTDSFECEYRIRNASGAFEWFIGRGRISKDAIGRRRHFAGSLRSIQSRKELEFQLRDQLRKRDRFLAMLSHELRNPLGAIMSAAGTVQRSAPADTKPANCGLVIATQAKHMRRLLDDLLDVSRLTHDKLALRRTSFDLCSLVKETVDASGTQFEEKDIALTLQMGRQSLIVNGDRDRICQCISNLVINALKYTSSGGRVEIDVFEAMKPESDGTRLAVITVADNGIGMDPEIVAHAFDLFCQADQSLAHAEGGLGVGLALVKGIVQLHGGSSTAYSDGPGKGSVFTLKLPLADGQEEPPALPSVPAESDANLSLGESGIRRIVLIDDLKAGRQMLALWLQTEDVTVIEAATGADGLAAIREHHPDAALVDVGLPDISGYEIAAALRADSGTAEIPLFAVTGYGQEKDATTAMEAGFDAHLVKPVDLDLLKQLLLKYRRR